MQVSFNETEDFVAVRLAEAWCVKHGFSFGFMQGNMRNGPVTIEIKDEVWDAIKPAESDNG